MSQVVQTKIAPLLTARDVHLSRGGRSLLEAIDLEIHAGEIVTLVGPNGAGKTTLLRVLLGLEDIDRGEIHSSDRLTVGYVPQKLALDPTLPLIVKRFLHLRPGSSTKQVERAIEDTGIRVLLDRDVHALSGGEMQRVLLARALVGNPDLLVLDEPTQGMDVTGQVTMFRLLAELRSKRGLAILLVSHDLHLVMRDTDRVICLNRHVCCAGTPGDVERDPAYLSLFGQPVPAELAPYQHHHDHDHDLAGHVHHDHALSHDYPQEITDHG